MANYDPRFLQMHATQHPSMMANMMARYGGNGPPAPPPMGQGAPGGINHRSAGGAAGIVGQGVVGGGGVVGAAAAEEAKKRQNVGWENTYKTAQRIPFPETRAACGEKVGEFVEDLARAIGCPVEFVLVPLLPCVGSLLGTHTNINVHRGWSEPPVLWSMVGAPQGSRRSAVIRQLLNPILLLQKNQKDENTAEPARDVTSQDRALYSGTRITLPAITEVLHRNDGHAFSLTENIENLHEMLGLLQPAPTARLVSVIEDLYEGLPLVAVENGRVTTILGSNFCHGGFSSPEYIVTVLMKYPSWLSSRLLMSCPVADHVKGVFGDPDSNADFPSLDTVYKVLLDAHKNADSKYTFDKEAVQELSRFFDEEWSSVLTQLEQNEHEALIGKSMGQIVRISGVLKSLENAIYSASAIEGSTNQNQSNGGYHWDWSIDSETIKCAITLGKYFLEQKLAMTFMVGTGFFNTINAMEDGTGSMNGSQDQDYPDSPTTLPQTAFHESSGLGQNAYQQGSKGSGGGRNNSNSSNVGNSGSDRGGGGAGAGNFGGLGHGGRGSFSGPSSSSTGGGGGGGGSNNNPYNIPSNTPTLPTMQQQQQQQQQQHHQQQQQQQQQHQQQQQQQHHQQQQHPNTPSSSKQQDSNSNQGSSNYATPTQQTNSLFELPKTNTEAEVDFSTLPQTMTTMEEDVSEMMQAIDFVHFSKTQFVAVHGRRIKRLLECYDDGHGVSATTAAQKSITPPVKVHGTNNRHPAWASALFFQKVAELELGIAEQGRHPHNRKVCWRFKRKPVSQLQERDFQLLQYLRIDMEKYSHFGSNNFNPAMMVNSGLISLGPSSNHSSQQSPSSSPIPSVLDDDGPGGNSQTSPGASGIPLSANQSGPRNPAIPLNIKAEMF